MRGWRLFVDSYKQWRVDPDVHRSVSGYGAVAFAVKLQRDDRRDTLQSPYFDHTELYLTRQVHALTQDMRTAFPATGASHMPGPELTSEMHSTTRPCE